MNTDKTRFIAWSVLFLASLVFCFVFHTESIGLANQKVAAIETQLSASPSEEELVQQGVERYKIGRFAEAIALFSQALPHVTNPKDRAAVHSNLALAYRQIGQLAEAIAHWEKAIQIYQRQDDEAARSQLPRLLTEQGQAYNDLGQNRRAIKILQSAAELARQNPDSRTQAATLGALGNAYWTVGNYEQALEAHQASLIIARQLNAPDYIATSLNNLGNLYISRSERYRYQANVARVEGDDKENARVIQLAEQEIAAARSAFEESLRETQGVGGITHVKALLNLNRLLEELPSPDWTAIAKNREQSLALIETLPDSRDKAYVLINLAQSFRRQASAGSGDDTIRLTSPPAPLLVGEGRKAPPFPCREGGPGGLGLPYPNSMGSGEQGRSSLEAPLLLKKALSVARNIGDKRAESFALGSLGQIYQSVGQASDAMELTQQAQLAAGQANAPDSAYRWQWQAGRLLKAAGKRKDAIASYEQAIATLQSIRSNLVAINTDLQFDFRDSVEPVYRELMQLLLEPSGLSSQEQRKINLSKVIDTLELLKLAELQNYFGNECVEVAQADAKSEASLLDANSAIIYSVILNDRTEMILRLPDGQLTNYAVSLNQEQMQQEIDQLRKLLEKRSTNEYLLPAQKIYTALIRPLEADLAAAKVKTLIFIQDDGLRQVSMAALHDGQQFLIQKYAIATTPSLTLTTRMSTPEHYSGSLIMGLTVERPPFQALTNVRTEVASVQKILGGTKLLDRDFTLTNLQEQLKNKSYPVVHIATHGKFGVDNASTFLLTFDSRITLDQIDEVLRQAKLSRRASQRSQQLVELLTLSACQTAAGDNRAALGIAGVAVRAGVRSALASLWNINDEATVPLIEEFYTQLEQPNVTKAEALQKAQLKMIANLEYSHPAVWSPFILIGNWL
jgi:CHAT domain-containing protein